MLAHLAVTTTYLGYLDQGRARIKEALSEARRLKRVHMLTVVLTYTDIVESITESPGISPAQRMCSPKSGKANPDESLKSMASG
jgi:hypothetical protein